MLFCGVFDGHGPSGHKVARHVRDTLPLNLSAALKFSRINRSKYNDVDLVDEDDDHNDNHNNSGDTIDCLSNANSRNLSLPSWEASLLECFKETDEVLCRDSSIDSFCSGSTAVAVVKQVFLETKLKEPYIGRIWIPSYSYY
jgi:serine/threonine protein phosphatase PrpC